MDQKGIQITNEEYHARPEIGSSDIKLVLRSPAHYKYVKSQPAQQTKAKIFGTAFHLAVLEPRLFKQNVIVMPKFSGKGMYEKKDLFLTENHGKIIITAEEMADIHLMLKSVSAHKTASALLTGGKSEQSFFWTDPATSVPCKCRTDYLGKYPVDIKTTDDASAEAFSRTILNFGYHISAAHYLNGLKAEHFLFIAVEKEPPYAVQIFELDFGTMEKGAELCARGLIKLKACHESGLYPAYTEEIIPIAIPGCGFNA